MFFQFQQLETGSRRTRSLAISAALHLVLLVVVVLGSDLIVDSARRVIRISGQDYDREQFEVTELVMPPDLAEQIPEPLPAPIPEVVPPDAVLVPVPEPSPPPPPPEPEPAPSEEAQAAPPPPPPPPEPEPEPDLPPPPVIGPDDVIAEGARPDATGGDEAEEPPQQPNPTITLEEPGTPAIEGNDGDGASQEGEGGDSLEDGGEDPETLDAQDGAAESEASAESPEETAAGGLLLPNLRDRARELAAENEERSRRDAATGRRAGTSIGSGDATPDFSTEQPTILSDTRGYDFGPYMNRVVNRVRVNWYSLIPEAARLRQVRGRVVIIFTIVKNGNVEDERIVANSNYTPLDNAAIGAIMASNPFEPIPADFEGENLVLQFTFLYNMQ